MTSDNKIINGLWIGTQLSNIELLTIRSFIRHGHDFYLWAYDKIETELPKEVVLRDANEIIPHEKIFTRKLLDPQANVGKGSYAGFSDIFRYKLLYEKGGWWVDMDITCLAPLNVTGDYYFRAHDKLSLIGNVMKCAKGSEAMKLTYEEATQEYNENSQDWLLTNKILERNVLKCGLQQFIKAGESNNDLWPETSRFIYEDLPVPTHYKFIHWMNEEWRSRGINKNKIYSDSTLGRILAQYGFTTYKKDLAYKVFSFLNRKITISVYQLIKILLALPFIGYAVWELYWFKHNGAEVVRWHTHLMAIVYLWLAGIIFSSIVVKRFSAEACKNAVLLVSSLAVIQFATESYFMISGMLKTKFEKERSGYISVYRNHEPGTYHVRGAKTNHVMRREEFQYPRTTNSLGYSDFEWAKAKEGNKLRILSLGDSFTEGDGAPYDSSYVALLKQKFSGANSPVYIMNAGICGSDPFFNFYEYKNRLTEYRPDVIIQTLSSQDIITDITVRGGMERFADGKSAKYKSPPWWEPIWAASYTSRIIFNALGYNEALINPNKLNNAEIDKQVEQLFDSYATLTDKHNCKLVVALVPIKCEVMNNSYLYNLDPIVSKLKSLDNVEVIDLLPYYLNYIQSTQTNIADYYWVLDGHHNSKGYKLMAEGIFENLQPVLKRVDSLTAAPSLN